MAKKLILAVAGSGKTYTLCNSIDESKRNLILAYTNENIKNIYNELIKSKGYIPEYTIISTFDSFILNFIARPLIPLIAYKYDKNFIFEDYGCAYNLKLPELYDRKTNRVNKKFADDKLAHYLTSTGKFYGERIPKFINKFKLIDISMVLIKQHFDNIYIDEVQDFAGERYELLQSIIENFDNVLLVGDYYQNSVSTRPDMKKYPFVSSMTYNKYKKEFLSKGVVVDETTLKYSRRCSVDVCNFIRKKLDIAIESANISKGKVIIISSVEYAIKVINDNSITKLVYENSSKCNFKALNWSYSKGDTLGKACVILNKNMNGFEKDEWKKTHISNIIINKLYVALSRTNSDLFILPNNIFTKCTLSKNED